MRKHDLPGMRAHLDYVLLANKVTANWYRGSWREAGAYPVPRAVDLPEITRPLHYAISLHEIGHVTDPMSRRLHKGTVAYDVILCESAAWAWALSTADPRYLRALSTSDWDTIAYAWRTYLPGTRTSPVRLGPSVPRTPLAAACHTHSDAAPLQ